MAGSSTCAPGNPGSIRSASRCGPIRWSSRTVRRWPRVLTWPRPFRFTSRTATSSSRCEAMAYRGARRFEAASFQCRPPLGNGMIKQFEHEAERRQFLFFDRAVVLAFERFSDYGIHLALHGQQFFVGFSGAHPGNHGQDSGAMCGVFLPFVAIQIVTQPGAGRTDPGEKQQRKPEIIAVPVEKGAFGAVDDGRRSPMYR